MLSGYNINEGKEKQIKGVIKMLSITITPTMLTFKELTEEQRKQMKEYELQYNEKGYYYIKGKPNELYKALLKLSYTFDIEIF